MLALVEKEVSIRGMACFKSQASARDMQQSRVTCVRVTRLIYMCGFIRRWTLEAIAQDKRNSYGVATISRLLGARRRGAPR